MDARRAAGWTMVAIGAVWGLLFAVWRSWVLVLVALALVLVGWRLTHRRAATEGREAAAPQKPAPVAALDESAIDAVELLAQLDGPVSACPRCGYLGVRAPGIRDGVWPGGGETGARFVCGRCHYQGIPIEFENGDDYATWVRELHGEEASS